MAKKDYLQPEIRVLILRHASVLAESPSPVPEVICDFEEDDPAGEKEFLF